MIPPLHWMESRLAFFWGGGAATDGVVKVDFEFKTGARLVPHDHLGRGNYAIFLYSWNLRTAASIVLSKTILMIKPELHLSIRISLLWCSS